MDDHSSVDEGGPQTAAASAATRRRRGSVAARHLDDLFEEMRTSEARTFLLPIIKGMRTKNGVKDTDNTDTIVKRDLQQLAVAWRLNQQPDFWKSYPTIDDLLRVLYKHAKKLKESNPSAPHMDVLMPSESHETKPINRNPEDWRRTLTGLANSLGIRNYKGDLFSQRGEYSDGLIYASRGGAFMLEGGEEDVGLTPASGLAGAITRRLSATAPAASPGLAPASGTASGTSASAAAPAATSAFSFDTEVEPTTAFEALRLSSTSTLVEISQNAALREEIADPSAIQVLFDTWRSSTHPQIRRNCALTLSNLYTTLDMVHDDLLLPILGLCTADSSVAELAACATAMCRRALLPRPLDVVFVPSLLTAVMSIMRRDGVTAQTKAECTLMLLQVLDNCIDNDGHGAPDDIVAAVNAVVTGGVSSTIAAKSPTNLASSPRAPGSGAPTSPSSPSATRRQASTNKMLPRTLSRNPVISAEASAAAVDAAKTLSTRPSFRLIAASTFGVGAAHMPAVGSMKEAESLGLEAVPESDVESAVAGSRAEAKWDEASGAPLTIEAPSMLQSDDAHIDSTRTAAPAGADASAPPHGDIQSLAGSERQLVSQTFGGSARFGNAAGSTKSSTVGEHLHGTLLTAASQAGGFGAIASTRTDPHLATRVALDYGLIPLLSAIIRSCQELLSWLGAPAGKWESFRPLTATARVPGVVDDPEPPFSEPSSDDDADARYLTDAVEYCTCSLLRVARLSSTHLELGSRHLLSCVTSLLSMQRTSIRDSAARIVYVLASSDDHYVTQDIIGSIENVESIVTVALAQTARLPTMQEAIVGDTTIGDDASAARSPAGGSSARAAYAPPDEVVSVNSPLQRLATRAMLSLSCFPPLVPVLAKGRGGDALMHYYHCKDPVAQRWALLGLCNLFEYSESGREELLQLGFLPVMIETVQLAIADAERRKQYLAAVKSRIGRVSSAMQQTAGLTGTALIAAAALTGTARPTSGAKPVVDAGMVSPTASLSTASRKPDRFASADAATRCAFAVCALAAGDAAVVALLLEAGIVPMLRDMCRVAVILLKEGIFGLGASHTPPKRGNRRGSAGGAGGFPVTNGAAAASGALPMPIDQEPEPSHPSKGGARAVPGAADAYHGIPPIYLPRVIAAGVAAVRKLSQMPSCHEFLLATSPTMLELLIQCVPQKTFLHGSAIPIPRHISDAVMNEWAAVEKAIQFSAVHALCALCTSPLVQQLVVSHSHESPSALEVLARVGGARSLPPYASAPAAAEANTAGGMNAGPAPSPKAGRPTLTRSPSSRVLRSNSVGTGEDPSAPGQSGAVPQTGRQPSPFMRQASTARFNFDQQAAADRDGARDRGRDRPKPFVWDVGAREACIGTVCVLTALPASHLTLLKLGAVPVFAAQTRHVHSRLRRHCAQALYNLTCTALTDVPGLSAQDHDLLCGLGRLKIMLDADVASALTIGALFRADDDTTRDLCAAAMYNLIGLTYSFTSPPEPPYSARLEAYLSGRALPSSRSEDANSYDGADGTDQADDLHGPRSARGLHIDSRERTAAEATALQCRRKLLAEGVLWAVIKLAQGFRGRGQRGTIGAGNLRAPAAAHGLEMDSDAASALDRILQGRYMTAIKFMRNMALDSTTALDAAKRHSVDMLAWYARQCALHYGAAPVVNEQALRGSQRHSPVGIASPSRDRGSPSRHDTRAAERSPTAPSTSPAPGRRRSVSTTCVMDAATVPMVLEAVSQTACLLASHTPVCRHLVARGMLTVLGRLLDIGAGLFRRLGFSGLAFTTDSGYETATEMDAQAGADARMALRLVHRVSVCLARLVSDADAAARMVTSGPLVMSMCKALLDMVDDLAVSVARQHAGMRGDATIGIDATEQLQLMQPRSSGASPIPEPPSTDRSTHSAADAKPEPGARVALLPGLTVSEVITRAATTVSAVVLSMSSHQQASNYLGTQGLLPIALRLCALGRGQLSIEPFDVTGQTSALPPGTQLYATVLRTRLAFPAPQRGGDNIATISVREHLVDGALRAVYNAIGHSNHATVAYVHDTTRALLGTPAAVVLMGANAAAGATPPPEDANRFQPQQMFGEDGNDDLVRSDPFSVSGVMLVQQLYQAVASLESPSSASAAQVESRDRSIGGGGRAVASGESSESGRDAHSAGHSPTLSSALHATEFTPRALADPTDAARVVQLASILSHITASADADFVRTLHDAALLRDLCRLAQRHVCPGVNEGFAVALANITSACPSRFLPRPVVDYMVQLMRISQQEKYVDDKETRTGGGSRVVEPRGSDERIRLARIRQLQPATAAAMLRALLLLLSAKPAVDSRPTTQDTGRKTAWSPGPNGTSAGLHHVPDAKPEVSVPVAGATTGIDTSATNASAASSGSRTAAVIAAEGARRESSFGASGPAHDSQRVGSDGRDIRTPSQLDSRDEFPTGPLPLSSSTHKDAVQRSQASQASLLTLKSLIDREHEEAARKARLLESPHLRPFIEAGVIDAIAFVATNARTVLKLQESLQARRAQNRVFVLANTARGGAPASAPQAASVAPKRSGGGAAGAARRRSIPGHATTNAGQGARRAMAPQPAEAGAAAASGTPDSVVWWGLPEVDEDTRRHLLILSHLCARCLLIISQSPDARGCIMGMDLQGPRPLVVGAPALVSPTARRGVASGTHSQLPASPPALSSPSHERSGRATWSQAAGIQALIALAKSGQTNVQRMAAESMACLTLTHQMRVRFLQERGVTTLAALARRATTDKVTQQWCGQGLRNLSEDLKLRQSVMEAGGVVQGVLMLLPDAGAADDGSGGKPSSSGSRPPGVAGVPGAGAPAGSDASGVVKSPRHRIPVPADFDLGIGLTLHEVFEVDGQGDDGGSVWTEDDDPSANADAMVEPDFAPVAESSPVKSTIHAPAVTREDGSAESGTGQTRPALVPALGSGGTINENDSGGILGVTMATEHFVIPRAWVPEPDTVPLVDMPMRVSWDVAALSITSSGVLPDHDAVMEWTLVTALQGYPMTLPSDVHASRTGLTSPQAGGSGRAGVQSPGSTRDAAASPQVQGVMSPAAMTGAQSPQKWTALLAHRGAADPVDPAKGRPSGTADAAGGTRPVRRSVQSTAPASGHPNQTLPPIPASAFKRRGDAQKPHAYAKVLPMDTGFEGGESASPGRGGEPREELGLTDAVLNEMHAKAAAQAGLPASAPPGTMLHMRLDALQRRALALLKPHALPDREMAGLIRDLATRDGPRRPGLGMEPDEDDDGDNGDIFDPAESGYLIPGIMRDALLPTSMRDIPTGRNTLPRPRSPGYVGPALRGLPPVAERTRPASIADARADAGVGSPGDTEPLSGRMVVHLGGRLTKDGKRFLHPDELAKQRPDTRTTARSTRIYTLNDPWAEPDAKPRTAESIFDRLAKQETASRAASRASARTTASRLPAATAGSSVTQQHASSTSSLAPSRASASRSGAAAATTGVSRLPSLRRAVFDAPPPVMPPAAASTSLPSSY